MDSKLYFALVKDDTDVLKGMGRFEDVRDQRTPANNTALHLACQHGSIGCVNEILTTHESLLFQTNLRGETALHLAARQGHYDVVEALVTKAKSWNEEPNNYLENTSATVLQNLIRAVNLEFETALHAAVRYNHEKVVELLVKEDPSYSYPRNKYDETPLYLAVISCYDGVTQVILDNCESPTYGGPLGRTALHAALMDKDGSECVRRLAFEDVPLCMELLLKKNKELIKVADSNGWTAFHYVAHNDLEEVVEFLMKVNKSVAYLADEKYKRTPLHVAASKGNVGVMQKFMKYLPDGWESVDGNGQNILHIAVREDQKSMIDYIWSQNIKRNLLIQRDNDGNTPLHLVAKFECYFPALDLTWDIVKKKNRGLTWDVDCKDPGLGVVNNTNFTPLDVLHQKQTAETQNPEALIGVTVDRSGVGYHWDEWIMKMEDEERNGRHQEDELNMKRYREKANTHMVVAALITTVALTAGFAMPGGFDGNPGPNQGSPAQIGVTVDRSDIKRHWDEWIMKIEEEERRSLIPQKIEQLEGLTQKDDELIFKGYREIANAHTIVAALITTVALTAGFAMPGGFDGNQGPKQGSPVLLRKTAFKTFMVADTIALLFSISSLFLYFLTSLNITRLSAFYSLVAATVSNVISITAMMVAFIAGTSAVLSHSSALTITVSIISSLFLFLVLYITFRACWVGPRLVNNFLPMVGLRKKVELRRKVAEGFISYNKTEYVQRPKLGCCF